MRILKIEPEHKPERADIPDTLEAMQEVVDGYMQAVYPFEEPVALICNEEGKLNGLPLNRALWEERFRCPEMFLNVNGKLVCLPVSPI